MAETNKKYLGLDSYYVYNNDIKQYIADADAALEESLTSAFKSADTALGEQIEAIDTSLADAVADLEAEKNRATAAEQSISTFVGETIPNTKVTAYTLAERLEYLKGIFLNDSGIYSAEEKETARLEYTDLLQKVNSPFEKENFKGLYSLTYGIYDNELVDSTDILSYIDEATDSAERRAISKTENIIIPYLIDLKEKTVNVEDFQNLQKEVSDIQSSYGSTTFVENAISNAIGALDAAINYDSAEKGYHLSITEVDGKITSLSGYIDAGTYDSYGSASKAQNYAVEHTDSSIKTVNETINNLTETVSANYNTLNKGVENANAAVSDNRDLIDRFADDLWGENGDITKINTSLINVDNDIITIKEDVASNKSAIDILNGTGDGSVSKAVSEGIAAVLDSAPESFDTLKEIADWIASDTTSTASLVAKDEELEQSINSLSNSVTNLEAAESDLEQRLFTFQTTYDLNYIALQQIDTEITARLDAITTATSAEIEALFA